MRKIKTFEADISATYDLTLIQRIPSDKLQASEQIFAAMLQAIRDAIGQREDADKASEQRRLRLVEAKNNYGRDCLALRRMRRRGLSLASLALINGTNQYLAREMLKHGNALARARLADIKKAFIIDAYRAGIGTRPAARMAKVRFGNCSPSYAAKIIKAYKLAIQPELPLPVLRAIR